MSQAITLTTRPDSVAVLTFDQPGSKANVLTRELWTEFGETLASLAPRTDLKGLVLASAKPGIFIAGADIKLLANAPAPNDPEVRAFIEQGLRVLEQLEALPFPTCAAIDGAALGGGLEVALACDSGTDRIAPQRFKLGRPEVKLGLIPGWGGTQRLPRIACLNVSRQQRRRSNERAKPHDPRSCSQHFDLIHNVTKTADLIEVVAADRLVAEAALRIAERLSDMEDRERKLRPIPAEQRCRVRRLRA